LDVMMGVKVKVLVFLGQQRRRRRRHEVGK
jgi:hypothetical protein